MKVFAADTDAKAKQRHQTEVELTQKLTCTK
jgi:hypothetical protein